MVAVLEVAVALIFFANKVFVLIGKKSGWLLGSIAAFLAVIYFYLIGLYIFTVLEIGIMILMGYGFWKKDEKNPKVEFLIRLVILVVMVTLTFFVFSGLISIAELTSSLFFLFGTFFLTHRKERLGWVLYCVAHIFSSYVGYKKDQDFFADFQVASAIVCFAGATMSFPQNKKND